MSAMWAVFRRELGAYFATPVAYVFIVIFLLACGGLTFSEGFGALFERRQADLGPFFAFHPWLYMLFVPALTMRLWAEERRGGTIELLMTLPIPTWAAVVGKFLAAWLFTGIALALTLPVWWTVAYLGRPDHGAIAAGYLGSLLMAGGFLAIGACISAMTRAQVIAFVVTLVVCFLMLLAGYPTVQDLIASRVPAWLSEAVAGMSFLTRFESISRGVLDARDMLFFATLITVMLAANTLVVEMKKS